MKYYVYIIVSIAKKKTTSYVGYTNNIKKRLVLHNTNKGAKFTKGRKWQLAYYKVYKSKVSAMKNEYILKKNKKVRNQIKSDFLNNDKIQKN